MVLPHQTKINGKQHELNLKKHKTIITNSNNKKKTIKSKKLTKVLYSVNLQVKYCFFLSSVWI
jgi:hypothetical protein